MRHRAPAALQPADWAARSCPKLAAALPDGSSMGPMPAALHDRYVALYQKFGEAWRVTKSARPVRLRPGHDDRTPTLKSWPLKPHALSGTRRRSSPRACASHSARAEDADEEPRPTACSTCASQARPASPRPTSGAGKCRPARSEHFRVRVRNRYGSCAASSSRPPDPPGLAAQQVLWRPSSLSSGTCHERRVAP